MAIGELGPIPTVCEFYRDSRIKTGSSELPQRKLSTSFKRTQEQHHSKVFQAGSLHLPPDEPVSIAINDESKSRKHLRYVRAHTCFQIGEVYEKTH